MTPAAGYTEMKDSGIEWVGEIPAHWNIFPAGGVFSEVKEKNVDNEYNNPFSFRYGEIVDKRVVGEIDENMEETLSAYRVVSPNTIMLNGLNLNYDFVSQRVAIVKRKGIITSAYLAIQPDEKLIYPPFALYLLKAYDFRQVLHGIGSGIRKTLKYSDFKNIKIIAPEMNAQKTIAAYLDTQCAKIDEIIAEAKASIEDYKKWKASIIYEAVTKGLDPTVEMKDSGIEWIGEIPKGWNINVLFQLISQVKNKNKDLVETNLLSLSYGKIKRKSIDHTDGLIPASFDGYNIIEDGDIVLRLTDLQNDQTSLRVGRATERGIITSAYTTLRPVNYKTSKFIYYLLHAFDTRKGFYGMGTGVRQGLNYDEVKVLKLPLPPIDEQSTIATYLDAQCAKIDELSTEKQSLISDLEVYKKSLIYEVVTGKRKVC